MRRGRIFIYLALLLIVGLGAMYILVIRPGTIAQQNVPTPESNSEVNVPPPPEKREVLAVAQNINRGDLITSDAITLITIDLNQYDPTMLGNEKMDLVVGQRARYELGIGMILREDMVFSSALGNYGSDAALLIPRGMVAVSIPISRLSSVSYAPQRGDHVNVIATMLMVDLDASYQSILPNNTAAIIAPGPAVLLGLGGGTTQEATSQAQEINAELGNLGEFGSTLNAQVAGGGAASPQGRAEADASLEQTFYVVPSEAQRPRLVSQAVLQDVIVLQVGNFETEEQLAAKAAAAQAAAAGETAPTEETAGQATAAQTQQEVRPPDIITLIVQPQDAVTLNYLVYSGAGLTLALRSAGDTAPATIEAVTMQYLLDFYNIPVPVKLPYGLEPRIDDLIAPVLPNDQPTTAPNQ